MAAHQNAISQICVELNALAEISRLPIELLTMIFECCTRASRKNTAKDLIAVTHVCKQWRRIALNAPHLWTRITLPVDIEFLRAAIHRSQKQLLDVTIYANTEDAEDVEALSLILDELPRIQHLYAEPPIGSLLDEKVKVPHLQTLNLFNCDPGSCALTIRELCSASSLHSVKLPLYHQYWQRLRPFTGLRHLTVGDFSVEFEDLSARSSVEDVVGCLRLLTSLETLTLHCHLLPDRPALQASRIPVPLPSLTEITLSGSAPSCVELLSRLTFPSLSVADLTEVELESDDENDDLLVAALIPIVHQTSSSIKTSGLPISLTLRRFAGKILLSCFGSNALGRRSLSLPELPVDIIHDRLLPLLPTDAVQVASVIWGDLRPADSSVLAAIMRNAHKIEELTVFLQECDMLDKLFEAEDSELPPYPHLRVLKIYYMHPSDHPQLAHSTVDRSCFGILKQALRSWARTGKKIQHLSLREYGRLSAENRQTLEDYADVVEESFGAYF